MTNEEREKIDHHMTMDEIVCPYCGHTHSDALGDSIWEWGDGGEAECGNCEKTFKFEIEDWSTWYSTEKLSEEDSK